MSVTSRFIILICVTTPALLLASGCDKSDVVEVARVDDQRSVNRILVTLADQNIDAESKLESQQRKNFYVILVPTVKANEARKVLVANDLPRPPDSGFDQMLATSSLIPTASEERARLMHAIGGELEKTMQTFDGVVAARVHVTLPPDNPLASQEKQSKPTVAVLLKVRGDAVGTTPDEKQVRNIVMKAVPDLENDESCSVEITKAAPSRFAGGAKSPNSQASTGASNGNASLNRILVWLTIALAAMLIALTIVLMSTLRHVSKNRVRA